MTKWRVLGGVFVFAGLVLQLDQTEGQPIGWWTSPLGIILGAIGLLMLVWRVDRRVVAATVVVTVGVLLIPAGVWVGWSENADDPRLAGSAVAWVLSVALTTAGMRALSRLDRS